MRLIQTILTAGLLSAASISYAVDTHTVIAPQCLLDRTSSTSYTTLASNNDMRLISIKHADIRLLANAKAAPSMTPCGGFSDVTVDVGNMNLSSDNANKFLHTQTTPPITAPVPPVYTIKHQAEVNTLLKQVIPENIWSDLTTLTSFKDRYADSKTGVEVAGSIQAKLRAIALAYDRKDIEIFTVRTGTEYKQPSVVLKIGTGTKPGIVIGAHMDTLDSGSDRSRMPGADDDGSGSSTVLEVARVLLGSQMTFDRPIYVIWYSAEEMGLVGSKFVTRYFKNHNIEVKAVLQMDLTGYRAKNDPTMWLITDHTNLPLTNYLGRLISTYVKQPVKRTQCGYACSDHASWTDIGVPASFPVETRFGEEDPYIHTPQDTMQHLTLAHMTNFAELGIAFATELAEPIAE